MSYELGFIAFILIILEVSASTGRMMFDFTEKALIALGLTVLMSFPAFLCMPAVGDGWKLHENYLIIKGTYELATVELSSTQIALIEATDPWRPQISTQRFNQQGMTTGWVRLKNGNRAFVFYHQPSSKILVLNSNDQYYLISHPGVENLYKKLLIQGVR